MVQDASDSPLPYDFAGQVIQIEADKLALEHGLDPERVRRIVRRTATDAAGNSLARPGRGTDNLEQGLRLDPSLLEALAFLAPEEVLTLFERTDPKVLSRRSRLYAYSTDPATPWHTLGELAELLDAFRLFLEHNQDPLIMTGFPRTGFPQSPWLEWHLSLLSPTKIPVNAFSWTTRQTSPTDQPQQTPLFAEATPLAQQDNVLPLDAHGALMYAHAWRRTAAPLQWSKDGPWVVRSFDDPASIELCSYGEAALFSELAPDIARSLEDGRAALFRLKLSIVNACTRALRSGNAYTVWPSVLTILTDSLLWREVQRYLEVEDLYWRAGLGAG